MLIFLFIAWQPTPKTRVFMKGKKSEIIIPAEFGPFSYIGEAKFQCHQGKLRKRKSSRSVRILFGDNQEYY